jgi:dCTP deaminase
MILSDDGIRQAIHNGEISIDPLPKDDQFQTSALDIFLGDKFRAWNLALLNIPGFKPELDLAEQTFSVTAAGFSTEFEKEQDGSIILPPYRLVPQVMLCQTRERISLNPDARLAARVEGRSSLARLGVMVHLTAPTIHAGFDGNITLEVINHGPFHLKMRPNVLRICQFIFERLETAPAKEIATAFQGQSTPIGGR